VIAELASAFDRVIVDTPPVQAVSDPLIIAKQMDAVVYVVSADHTRSGAVRSGIAKLLQAENNLYGVVLNRVDMKKAAQTYSYYGQYGYYYDYSSEGHS
jgi:succinoglycan biosynthesis transport protein ExoP